MLRDTLVGLIEPMQISAGVDPLALTIRKQASDDSPSCLENPRPERAESSLTENATSPFQAEPAQKGVAAACSTVLIHHVSIAKRTPHRSDSARVSKSRQSRIDREQTGSH